MEMSEFIIELEDEVTIESFSEELSKKFWYKVEDRTKTVATQDISAHFAFVKGVYYAMKMLDYDDEICLAVQEQLALDLKEGDEFSQNFLFWDYEQVFER